jgi:histidine triad (HIT) family protein
MRWFLQEFRERFLINDEQDLFWRFPLVKEIEMSDCLFCKIVRKEIPSDMVYQDDDITIFKDINPAAPVHLLVIPNLHIPSVQDMEEEHEQLFGKLFLRAKEAAVEAGIDESGYRLIVNNGPDGRQEIHHIHMHVLGGAKMQHPMG